MEKTIVLYPGLSVSHFFPMMQLSDALLAEGYAVTVALMDPSLKGDIALATVIDRVSSSKPSDSFRRLPRIQDPPTIVHDAKFVVRYLDLVSRYHQHLHDLLVSMPPGSVHALVVDVMSIGVLDVTGKLGIPVYALFPMSASVLAACVQVSSIRAQVDGGQPSFQGLGDTPLLLHGVPPVPASHLFSEMLESPSSEASKAMTNTMRRVHEAKGILVNTFASLEPRAVEALSDPRCLPTMPSLYCVGPLVAGPGEATEQHECLAWLDEQPEHSVVFLCFGSVGTGNHSRAQLKEIAMGLEKSGHMFLWVVRAPPHDDDDPEKPLDPRADPDLDDILPEGFLERTNGRGLVLKLWAPQVDVLHHRATGAFVTHCGWNSVLEGITAGVPMICWPLYAEQKMNKVFMVEEYGVGVEMVGWQQGLVKAEEVEAKVRLVMESEEGGKLRAQVMAHKQAAAMAWEHGGSSRAAFGEFLLDTQAT
ncbi:hypothetical protein BS78_09G209900 [Paspalum vaginatum]|nr:hypothetical protein BS78_09G209900 [Paspalum vaginatum]